MSGLFSRLFGSKSGEKDVSEGDVQTKEDSSVVSKSEKNNELVPVKYVGPKIEIRVKESSTSKDIESEEMRIAKQVSSWCEKE